MLYAHHDPVRVVLVEGAPEGDHIPHAYAAGGGHGDEPDHQLLPGCTVDEGTWRGGVDEQYDYGCACCSC
jgi:hypothetical protein